MNTPSSPPSRKPAGHVKDQQHAPTLEQKRALDAWKKSVGCDRDYQVLAKGLPALIMHSGLMQVLAFCHEKAMKKKNGAHDRLSQHLFQWLKQRFPTDFKDARFETMMQGLMQAQSARYQAINAEAFAWLRWLRQIAAARGNNQRGDKP